MYKTICRLFPAAAILLSGLAVPCNATLAGSSVTGSLTFAGDPSNYFDPGYGFVPATGYLNAAGTSVTISDNAVEFGFNDGSSLISADFSNNHLTVNDKIELAGPTNSFQMIFTDTAFRGQYLRPISDSFPFADYSVVGGAMTLDYAGGNAAAGQTFTGSFLVTPVPEPSSLGYFGVLVLVGLRGFRRRFGGGI